MAKSTPFSDDPADKLIVWDDGVSKRHDRFETDWAVYYGNGWYPARALAVMDACAAFLVDCGRLPSIGELRIVTGMSDADIVAGGDGLKSMGWTRYSAICDQARAATSVVPRWHLRPRTGDKAPIPTDLRRAVWARDDFTCRRCGSRERLSVDHVIPECQGGQTAFGNLQTLCSRCNSAKGAR